jgi:hypothetical protein
VGDIGWEYEYEDCLTDLYRYLVKKETHPPPSLQPSPAPSSPSVPVPYPEKYNAEWKKRMCLAPPLEITPKEQLPLSTLKHNVLLENTPFGNVIMYYDDDKGSFIYYSDKTLSYPIINAVGKKYVLTFHCESLYNDVDAPPRSVSTPSPEEPPTPTPTLSPPVAEKTKSNVFAKFKNYRDPGASSGASSAAIGGRPSYKNTSTVPVTSATNPSVRRSGEEGQKEPPPKNRYTCEGKLANYNFLQKVAKVKPFSYKDFKRKMNPPKVISV